MEENAHRGKPSSCGLCEREAKLCTSHVLPAFVYRWFRETSLTGHIRFTGNVDRRVQDGEKKRWLCADCEALFSKEERAFASKLFHPRQEDANSIEYGPWLQRFCTSVSWRVLSHCKGSNPDFIYSPEQEKLAERARRTWRDYLLGKRSTIGKYEQHLLPLGIIDDTTIPDLPQNINRYFTRSIEMDIIGGAGHFMTYAKLGRFAIFGMIKRQSKWEGTRVFGERGWIEPRNYSVPGALMHYMMARARMIREAHDRMSPAQVAKVEEAVMRNIDRASSSEQIRAMFADAKMFGVDSILRK